MPLDIIIIAAAAAFIFLRLRSELGNKTGNEPLPPAAGRGPVINGHSESVDVQADDAGIVDLESNPELRKTYKSIRQYDTSFDPITFQEGATTAYGMILEAFWDGDTETLEGLLDDSVFGQFTGAIEEREKNELTLENKLLDITDTKVISGQMAGNIAELTVQFTSEIVAITRNKEGELVEGDASDAVEMNDKWTFARNVRSKEPSWTLIATRAG